MTKLIWKGDGDPEAQEITQFGYTFAKGEPVDVTDAKTLTKLSTNPLFSGGEDVDTDEADAEVTELRKLLDDLNVTYSKAAKAPALRAKLDEATK